MIIAQSKKINGCICNFFVLKYYILCYNIITNRIYRIGKVVVNSMENGILKGFTDSNQKKLYSCLNISELHYTKGDIIMPDEIQNCIWYIKSGQARLITVDEDGNTSIILYLNTNDIVSADMIFEGRGVNYFLEILMNTEIMSMDLQKAIYGCENNCDIHCQFKTNLIEAYTGVIKRLSQRNTVTTGRTIRKKLTEYLNLQRKINRSVKFKIPVSMAELADYLCVDRSAMLRELKKMKDEGLILLKNRYVTILV